MKGLVEIDYTNYRGERRTRRIIPMSLLWGSTEWHPQEQWILWAKDPEDGYKVKGFSMKDVHGWTPVNEVSSDKG